MGEQTGIEWADSTHNPGKGCVKKVYQVDGRRAIRPECENCYMYREAKRFGFDPVRPVRTSARVFHLPHRLQKKVSAGELAPGHKVFVCSWTDFNNRQFDSWRDEYWQMIRECPDLTFMILTKLVHRFLEPMFLPAFWGEIRNRVWLGATIGVPEVIEHVIGLDVDPAVRFVSVEPLLGEIDLSAFADWVDWVIIGGESGGMADTRPMHPANVVGLLEFGEHFGVPVFFKQWGSYRLLEPGEYQKQRNYEPGRVVALDFNYPLKRIEIRSKEELVELNMENRRLVGFEYAGIKGTSGGVEVAGRIIRQFPRVK